MPERRWGCHRGTPTLTDNTTDCQQATHHGHWLQSATTSLTDRLLLASRSSLLLFWHAPLGVCSTKRRHQSPEWTILSRNNCFIQGEVVGSQVLLDSLHPRSTRVSWWSPPVLQRDSCYNLLGICFIWHSRNVAKQGEMQCLDNSQKVSLHGCRSHFIVLHMEVSLDS